MSLLQTPTNQTQAQAGLYAACGERERALLRSGVITGRVQPDSVSAGGLASFSWLASARRRGNWEERQRWIRGLT